MDIYSENDWCSLSSKFSPYQNLLPAKGSSTGDLPFTTPQSVLSAISKSGKALSGESSEMALSDPSSASGSFNSEETIASSEDEKIILHKPSEEEVVKEDSVEGTPKSFKGRFQKFVDWTHSIEFENIAYLVGCMLFVTIIGGLATEAYLIAKAEDSAEVYANSNIGKLGASIESLSSQLSGGISELFTTDDPRNCVVIGAVDFLRGPVCRA